MAVPVWIALKGGYGNDTYVVDSVSEIIKEFAGQGSDWVQSATFSLDLNNLNWGGSIESARLTGTTVNLNVTGNDIDNVLIGNDAGNVLDGRGGVDALQGGKGDDTYYVDTITDVLLENVSEGADTIQSSVNFSIENLLNFENISLSPGSIGTIATGNSNNNTVKGNEFVNTLFGLAGNDIFDGGAGADNLIGGSGDDTYSLSNDGDIITELANEGSDTVEIGVTYTLSDPLLNGNVENLKLTGTDAVNGTGSNGANTITGNSKANTLTGLEGADRLIGGDGTDTLIGGLGADVIDLTESLAVNDIVKVNIGDSNLNAAEADRIIKFAFA
ncbi:MAG: calcium-binding protein, partial [Methylococcaceae bacterium]